MPASSFPPAAPTPAIEAESEESERVGGQERERAREGEQKREGEIEREPESSSFLYIPPPAYSTTTTLGALAHAGGPGRDPHRPAARQG